MKGEGLKVYFDGQIFIDQVIGGISRYYASLAAQLHITPGVSARVIAPFHRNEHLAEQRGTVTLGRRLPADWRAGRICWAALRVGGPLISALGRPDIVHETYYAPRPYLTTARRRVTTVYDMIHELYYPGSETSEYKKRTLERCDHVLCISRNTQKDLCEMFDFPIERTSVTYLSYKDFSFYGKAALSPALLGAPYFLFVGKRDIYKNFSLLLEAFSSDAVLRKNFRIVAIGGGALTADELALCKLLGLAPEHVTQLQGGDDLLGNAYAHATALVYPSLYEGFGISPLEAMSVECPVLSSNASSLPEVVGDAALVFDPQKSEALREAMVCVANSDALRRELALRGKLHCRGFTWERCAQDTLAAYRRLL